MTNNNFFNGFDAVPAFAPFQTCSPTPTSAARTSPSAARRSLESSPTSPARTSKRLSRPAALPPKAPARSARRPSLRSRDGFEQAADAIRSLAEAKSPTEYLQLQSEFARASFDRAVAESSKLTESLVKLAGEAFQPLSNRATANAERFNTLVA